MPSTFFLNFAIPLFLTIIIECSVAFFLKYRNSDYMQKIALINIFTNPAFIYFNIAYNVFYNVNPSNILIYTIEIFIILIECKLLMISTGHNREKMLVLSFSMNAASYAGILLINSYFSLNRVSIIWIQQLKPSTYILI